MPDEALDAPLPPDPADLNDRANGVFALRLNSDTDPAQIPILLETRGATPGTPYVVAISQTLPTPFLGGQFDLVELDVTDATIDSEGNIQIGAASEVLVASTSGFQSGLETEEPLKGGGSQISRVIMTDKIYRVVFAPGSKGDGVYSIHIANLTFGDTGPTEE